MTRVLHTRIDAVDYSEAVAEILIWSGVHASRYVCAANVHVLMEAHDSADFSQVVNEADLMVPDGMPLVWMMRWKGRRDQPRVYGPTLMLHVLDAAAREKVPVGFYGGEPNVLKALVKKMQAQHIGLDVAISISPPFRELSLVEDEEIVRQINLSGARILFVGLGCPKQEMWMAAHRGKVQAVMIGVGAAFDFHAGVKPQAPAWIQRLGLEWAFRLTVEPRRLWRRYLYHNPRFLFLALADLLGVLKD
jgi:N-acetylglucosaminyldiphosphoundecaprenol N-acetyl-beta-D-mannosaminyltransferase